VRDRLLSAHLPHSFSCSLVKKTFWHEAILRPFACCARGKLHLCPPPLVALLRVQDDEDSYSKPADDAEGQRDVVQEAIRNDELRRLERAERAAAESAILRAAKIIAPRIANSYEDGYDWCIEQVRQSYQLCKKHF